ncbi:MAG: hypothetical protein R2715_16980 [Ilumatobacteraceae bacterium]
MLHGAGREVDGQLSWPLADKELRFLLESVAATGATPSPCSTAVIPAARPAICRRQRFASGSPMTSIRFARPGRYRLAPCSTRCGPRPVEVFLPGSIDAALADEPVRHVALCVSVKQTAKEDVFDGEHRGVFSESLMGSLPALSPSATYRDLLAVVRERVERDFPSQQPDLFPETAGGAGDGRFLDGTIEALPPSYSMTRSGTAWTIDAGRLHGITEAVDGNDFVFACADSDGVQRGDVRVLRCGPASCTVEPIDWEPDQLLYRAVVTRVARPVTPVGFAEPATSGEQELYEAIRARIASCGPEGRPSVQVRCSTDPAERCLRVRAGTDDGGAFARIERPDGSSAASERGGSTARTWRPAQPSGGNVGARGPLGCNPRARRSSFTVGRRGLGHGVSRHRSG